jgi:Domain of unknown function (DUF1843)
MASNVRPYGPPINDALRDPSTKLSTLVALHKRATAILKSQGDLEGAVKRLEKEISRRKGKKRPAKKKK